MQRRRALLAVSCILGLIAATISDPQPAAQAKESMAGHWHLVFYGKCVDSRSNLQACAALQGPAAFPIMGVPGTVLIVKGVGDYIADARGHYTVRFITDIIERAPHARPPRACSNVLVFGAIYNGTCQERGTGHGHIAPGRTGMPDFWQDDTAGVWSGSPPARFADATPTDTSNPACPGVYDTKRFMALFGFKTVPVGITAHVVLIHHR
jgi:hypothetical protein